MQTTEPLVPEPSSFRVEITTEKLKVCKSPGIYQILAGLVQTEGNTLHSEIHKLTNSIWSKEELPQQWEESIIVPVYQMGDKTDCSYYRHLSLLPTTFKILSNILVSKLTPYVD
jgi:hypothetical protein